LLSNVLYSTGGAPKRCGAWGNFPLTLPLEGPGCVNNTLINALQKINALKALLIVLVHPSIP